MATTPTESSRCIFWSDTGKRCTSNSDGLFIPNERHITVRCTSAKYVLCERYVRDQQLQNRAEKEVRVNRRKHARTPAHYAVLLRYINPAKKTFRDRSTMADTIDFSDGGLQIASRIPLPADTLVHVIYTNVAQEELALVRWCIYREDTVRYLAGLSFHSHVTDRNRPLYSSLPLSGPAKTNVK